MAAPYFPGTQLPAAEILVSVTGGVAPILRICIFSVLNNKNTWQTFLSHNKKTLRDDTCGALVFPFSIFITTLKQTEAILAINRFTSVVFPFKHNHLWNMMPVKILLFAVHGRSLCSWPLLLFSTSVVDTEHFLHSVAAL